MRFYGEIRKKIHVFFIFLAVQRCQPVLSLFYKLVDQMHHAHTPVYTTSVRLLDISDKNCLIMVCLRNSSSFS